MSRVAATEWGPDGINVNVVCPRAWTAALENFQEAYPDAFTANAHMPPWATTATWRPRSAVSWCSLPALTSSSASGETSR